MSILNKVLSEFKTEEVIESAAEQSHRSLSEHRQLASGRRFAEVGVSAFMARQAQELTNNRFAARAEHNSDERGVAGLHFVATQDERFDDGGPSWGIMNEYYFIVRAFGETVRWECKHRRRSEHEAPSGEFDISELSVDKLNDLYEQALRFSMWAEKKAKEDLRRRNW